MRKTDHRTLWLVAAFATLLISIVAVAAETPGSSTEQIARRYVDAVGRRDLNAQPFAETAIMRDLTADFFGMPDLVAGVRGREAIVGMQQSWNLRKIRFGMDQEFFVNEYAVFSGVATVSGAESVPRSMAFLTVLRVQDDAVSERHDFWNYAEGFGANETKQANAKDTRAVADAYLKAYLEQRFDDARKLMADDIDFQDPTAAYFGPQGGRTIQGADELTRRRQATFAGIFDFGLDVRSSFVTNHHAVYIGRTHYALPGSAFQSEVERLRFEHPAAFVIGVRDGRVVFHRDYVDYSNFRSQARVQMPKG